MYYMLFGGTAFNFRRWNYCAAGIAFILAAVWLVINFASPPESGSRGWGPAMGYALLAAAALFLYWALLLAQLCSALKLNTALWVVCSIVAPPLSVAIVHFLVFFKV